MHWFWAVIAAVLLAAGVVWWMDHEAHRSAQHAQRPHRASTGDRGPTLYRWIDASGVVNITDRPPKGRSYSIVRIDPDRNIVPMSQTADRASAPVVAHRPR